MTKPTTQPAMELPALPELLPCPFCGGEAAYAERETFEIGISPNLHFIKCKSCGASGATGGAWDKGKALARKIWNRRASASSAAVGEKRCHFAGCPHGAECVHATPPSAQQEGGA